MPLKLNHHYVNKPVAVTITRDEQFATVSCNASGRFSVTFPGSLLVVGKGTFSTKIFVREFGAEGAYHPGKWVTTNKSIPLTVEIRTPDGKLFTARTITLADLKKYRDLRGTSKGSWSYKITGEVSHIPVIPDLAAVAGGKASIIITVAETVASKSAAAFVDKKVAGNNTLRYAFDLFRVGTFTATTQSTAPLLPLTIHRRMRLIDPSGAVVATNDTGILTYPVTLRTLDKSRDKEGNARQWTLELLPSPTSLTNSTRVWASVIETTYIRTSVLQERIKNLIGENGEKVSIYAQLQGSKLLVRLQFLDEISAEIVDMHGLFDSVINSVSQDPGVDKDIEMGVAYNIVNTSKNLDYKMQVSRTNIKVGTIGIAIGASEHMQPSIPALKIDIRVAGDITIALGGFPLATLKIRGNRIRMEVGLVLNPNGTFTEKVWVEDNLVDLDIHWATALAAGVLSPALILLGLAGLTEYFESVVNSGIYERINSVLSGAMSQAPKIMAVILGDVFTYRSLRLDGNDIVIDYYAPAEPDLKPSKNYTGIIGRSALQVNPVAWQVTPDSLGDTWKADNLAKIDHIVVVMMENRSFDHVLGYLAQLPGTENSDGLTRELRTFLEENGYPVRKLNRSGIPKNEFDFKTKFPVSVGHDLADVVEQLSETLEMGERIINSPKGFVDNFTPKIASHPELKKEDVLGYYEAKDLPFFKFLVDNYAYCEKFYCSHPGPTLPNRAYSLTGDVQYDRVGEAILDNNNGDNFYLSRATTIYDLLTRKGIGWRVYESAPSVTMLRMFARYATDNTNIVNISRLKGDVSRGDLPALTIVDPAMHHYPENDDHAPDADMYNGQVFLKEVYDTLTSNDSVWRKTLLIITYDEHGGFYDHVVPPVADLLRRPLQTLVPGESLDTPFTPSSVTTNYGVRVPTFVVSPWTQAGKGPDIVLDFCSILKTIIARFCGRDKPFLSDRVSASLSFDSYLSAASPRTNVEHSPEIDSLPVDPLRRTMKIATKPISRKQMKNGKVDYHDLTGMLGHMLGR